MADCQELLWLRLSRRMTWGGPVKGSLITWTFPNQRAIRAEIARSGAAQVRGSKLLTAGEVNGGACRVIFEVGE